MVTSAQIRAARAALGWSAEELARRCAVSRRTLVAIEGQDGVPSANARTLDKLAQALRDAGVEFVGTPGEGPGIRIWDRRDAGETASTRSR